MAEFTIQKQKIDAYAYLVRVGVCYIYVRDNEQQKEVPNEYKKAVAESISL